MRFAIIVGANNVSIQVAKLLVERQYEVSVIDNDEGACEKAFKALKSEASVYKGDPRSPDVLNEVGIDKAEILMALSVDDEVNYEVCRIAREKGVPVVIARVNDKSKEDLFKELNVTTVNVEDMITNSIGNLILGDSARALFTDPSSGLSFAIVRIKENSKLVGRKLGDVVGDYGVTIPYVIASNGAVKSDGDYTVEGGIELVVVGPSDSVRRIISDAGE